MDNLEKFKKLKGWNLKEEDIPKIERKFEFKDFKEAMQFVNKVADIAEEKEHHPDIEISYNKVKLTLHTHSADGLTDKDFTLAKVINDYYS